MYRNRSDEWERGKNPRNCLFGLVRMFVHVTVTAKTNGVHSHHFGHLMNRQCKWYVSSCASSSVSFASDPSFLFICRLLESLKTLFWPEVMKLLQW